MEKIAIFDETETLFHPEQIVRDIDNREATRVGRGLTEVGCRMLGNFVVSFESDQTVALVKAEIEKSKTYQKDIDGAPNVIMGPFFIRYGKNNEFDFCPKGGAAAWRVPRDK